MRFKDFEIRECKEGFRKYEIVKWCTCITKDEEFCYIIAFIEYNFKEWCWEFRSVGTRYLENREDGLEEYILKYIELLNISQKYMEKQYND